MKKELLRISDPMSTTPRPMSSTTIISRLLREASRFHREERQEVMHEQVEAQQLVRQLHREERQEVGHE